jgi:hypothetical protein
VSTTAPTVGWQVLAGASITASLADPPGGISQGVHLGARVEVPVSRAIVSYWQAGTLSAGIWTVTLVGVPEPGAFQFVWRTDDAEPPEYEVFIPIQIVPNLYDGSVAQPDYPDVDLTRVMPSVDDVAKLERTRTVHEDGSEVTTFDSDTRPTDVECQALIEQAVDDVLAMLPTTFNPDHYRQTRRVVTLYAAMLVEGSFYKEQALARSSMPWEVEYNAALSKLCEFIKEDRSQDNLIGVMEPRTPYTWEPDFWQPGFTWDYYRLY